ncbi:hypothetical protein MPER_01774, partial [Moniliophthora perniciosa FA553]
MKYRLQSDNLELITMLECVCADGTAPIEPCLVFQGKLFCAEWFVASCDFLFATTETGWTNNEVYAAWFEKCFVPQAKAHADPTFPIVLI